VLWVRGALFFVVLYISEMRDDRSIIVSVKRHRFCTAKEIQRDLAIPALCLNTIRSRIKESGEFNSYWAIHKPFISKKNQRKRVEWCRQHLNWTPEQCSSIVDR
jgi:hypothetical protein